MNKEKYILKKLSAEEILESLLLEEKLEEELMRRDFDRELTKALCEYGVLCYLTIYDGDKRHFSSPRDVLKNLTISELADVYDAYIEKFYMNEQITESGLNESFEIQLKEKGAKKGFA